MTAVIGPFTCCFDRPVPILIPSPQKPEEETENGNPKGKSLFIGHLAWRMHKWSFTPSSTTLFLPISTTAQKTVVVFDQQDKDSL